VFIVYDFRIISCACYCWFIWPWINRKNSISNTE